MKTIGTRIAQLRREKGMKQEELANAMGLSPQAVSKWENDVSCPDISALPQLAALLGTTTDYLLSGREDEVRCVPPEQRKSPDELTLHIRVCSGEGDKVQVNLPIPLLKALTEGGGGISAFGIASLENIDMKQIMSLIENGTVGKLVEVKSVDGDFVEIVVE